jgi:hypothetical protein
LDPREKRNFTWRNRSPKNGREPPLLHPFSHGGFALLITEEINPDILRDNKSGLDPS